METPVPLKDLTFDYRDEFDRKSIAEKVIKLLDAEMDFCPMAIDGGWGTGKTEFCHKLINLIKEQDARRKKAAQEAAADAARTAENAEDAADAAARADTAAQPATDGEQAAAQATAVPPERAVIYLDAFASETVDDPLLCILAAIRAEFLDEETRKEIRQRVMSVMKMGWKVILKAFAAHLLKQDGEGIWAELTDAAQDGANDLIDRTVDNLLDQYAHAQQNIEALQETIAKAAAQRPILFFIDELDRCRPDFALSILELVKHVFDIPGVKFIFVANLEQLKAAIRKRYGQDVDADVYLEKFINLSILLPSVCCNTGLNAAYILLKNNFQSIGIFDSYFTIYTKIAIHFIKKYEINLRGVGKFIRNMKIYCTVYGDSPLCNRNLITVYHLAFVLAIFIFTFNKDVAYRFILDEIDDSIYTFMGDSSDKSLNNMLIFIADMVLYGRDFDPSKGRIAMEHPEETVDLLNIMFDGRFHKYYFDVRKLIADHIRKMNFIPVNG